jgi:EpsI family protein
MKPVFDSFSEPASDRRKFLLALLFCSAAGVAAWRQPSVRLDYLGREKLEDLVPKTIGRWKFVTASGLVVPPEDQLSNAIYSQLLTRVYSDGANPPVMLLVAQSASQTGFLQIHRPETCYTAGGFQISPITPRPISLGAKVLTVNGMEASNGSITEHVVYWTRVGDDLPRTWNEQKIATAEQNLKGIIPDAILVRISSTTPDAQAARVAIDEFTRMMLTSIPPDRRSVFVV